jgi:hypothetical protein
MASDLGWEISPIAPLHAPGAVALIKSESAPELFEVSIDGQKRAMLRLLHAGKPAGTAKHVFSHCKHEIDVFHGCLLPIDANSSDPEPLHVAFSEKALAGLLPTEGTGKEGGESSVQAVFASISGICERSLTTWACKLWHVALFERAASVLSPQTSTVSSYFPGERASAQPSPSEKEAWLLMISRWRKANIQLKNL